MIHFEDLLEDIRTKGWSHQLDVLSPLELKNINAYFEQMKREFVPAKVGKDGGKQRNDLIRGDYTPWIDSQATPAPLQGVVESLKKIRELMNMSFYFGLKDFECHLAYYPPGSFYQKHVDRHHSGSTRSLSFIFYLNESWRTEDGGELILYDKGKPHSLFPMPGSLVCFLSDEFPHEVRVAQRERRSFTGWMHTKILS